MSSRFSDSQSEGRNSSSAGDNDKNDSDDDEDDDDDDDAGHSSNVMSIFASYYGIEATGEGANGSPKGVEDHKRPAIGESAFDLFVITIYRIYNILQWKIIQYWR